MEKRLRTIVKGFLRDVLINFISLDLGVEIVRTLVEGLPFPLSNGDSCGTTSDFSGLLEGSTNMIAAFEGG